MVVSWDLMGIYPLVMTSSLLVKMATEIVDLPIENGGSFHSYVSHYQRVNETTCGGLDSLRDFLLFLSGEIHFFHLHFTQLTPLGCLEQPCLLMWVNRLETMVRYVVSGLKYLDQ